VFSIIAAEQLAGGGVQGVDADDLGAAFSGRQFPERSGGFGGDIGHCGGPEAPAGEIRRWGGVLRFGSGRFGVG
jgi:hypothetical protein